MIRLSDYRLRGICTAYAFGFDGNSCSLIPPDPGEHRTHKVSVRETGCGLSRHYAREQEVGCRQAPAVKTGSGMLSRSSDSIFDTDLREVRAIADNDVADVSVYLAQGIGVIGSKVVCISPSLPLLMASATSFT